METENKRRDTFLYKTGKANRRKEEEIFRKGMEQYSQKKMQNYKSDVTKKENDLTKKKGKAHEREGDLEVEKKKIKGNEEWKEGKK